MNLEKLFEAQKGLSQRIVETKGLQGKDLLDEKILALQVELGELANEWRGFKFWSEDRKPRTEYICELCDGSEEISVQTAVGEPDTGFDVYDVDVNCPLCEDVDDGTNPLLEEYVDCLHFILDIGIDISQTPSVCDLNLQGTSITRQFNGLFYSISRIKTDYYDVVMRFVGLGIMLGFAWSQIEKEYYRKNKINHARQENGY